MECLTGFASSIARDLVCGAGDELRYPCCFNNFVEDLQNEQDKFVETRKSVQERLDHAKKQTKKTAELVHKWLKQANTDIDNVEKLLEEARRNKSCCFGHCPNWIWRYRLGKKLAEKKRVIEVCNAEGSNYTQIERLASLPGLGYFPSEKCLKFVSRKLAYEELMEALKGDDVTMIGLWGMGGCGKTTLAMEVGKRAEAEHVFDRVLFVPVSSTVEVRRIQDKIASALQFEFPKNEEIERAKCLCMRITQEKRILLILDDVWQMLDFEATGIPSSKSHKDCKVLITSRLEAVCTLMDCQRKIHLSILTDDEAWTLFQKYAQISEGTSDTLKHLARQISNECKGLPVAIAAVASTLKGKFEVEWKVALDRLRSSKPVNIEKGLQNPYNCLQLSYDHLNSEEAKSLFLLCSVFPEDYEILIEDLTRFAIGLGVVKEFCSYERARNEVNATKNMLVSSSLLLDVVVGEGKCVKMHDLVRDVALWIAKNENKVIECVLEKDVRHAIVEYNSPTYLWCEEFPNELDYSNLEFLCTYTNLEVSDEIFKGMGKLKVLLLMNKSLWRGKRQLSISLKSLTNLRCLLLEGWELGDMISFIGDMTKLESLRLHKCSFLELPDVLEQLTSLRLLDISECHMKGNPSEVIGRHPKLEELYIADDDLLYDQEALAEFFKKFSVPQALQRYQIQLGTILSELNHQRILCTRYFDASNVAVKDLAKRAEVVSISNILGGSKNIIPDIFQIEEGGMKELIHLMIYSSSDIVCLVDTSYRLGKVGTIFPKLVTLRISFMEHLGSLCRGLPPSGLFGKLEELYLSRCPELTSLFEPVFARNLVQLKILEISDCDGLKQILTDDDGEEISTEDHSLMFPKLKRLIVVGCKELEYIIPVTFARGLLQLECLNICGPPKMKYVFGQCKHGDQLPDQTQNELKVKLLSLQELELTDMPNIVSVFPENCYATWPSLRRFELNYCAEFTMMSINSYLADSKVQKQCNHSTTKAIKEVRAIKNSELEGVFQLAGLSIDGEQDPLTICLQKLRLRGLPQLRHICSGPIQYMNFQNLERMEVRECRELTCIVSACIAGGLPLLKELEVSECRELKCIVLACYKGGLPQLKELRIRDCNQLEQIIEDEKHQNFLNLHLESNQLNDFSASTSTPSAPVGNYSGSFNLSSLTRLTLQSCSMLGSLFTPSTAKTLISLEELMIEDCQGLKHILTYERVHKNKKEEIVQDDHDCQSYIPMFPSLKKLRVMRCHLLQYIFPVSFARGLAKLKYMQINDTPKLKYLFGPSNLEDCSYHRQQNKILIELPVLKELDLKRIPNLISICPDSHYAIFSCLRVLCLYWVELSGINCSTVTSEALWNNGSIKEFGALSNQIINETALLQGFQNVEEIHIDQSKIESILQLPPAGPATNRKPGLLTSYLKMLILSNLPELMYICKGLVQSISLQYLEIVGLYHCNNLKCIFSSCIARGLPQLKELTVMSCDKLEQIFENEENQEFSDLPRESCQVEDCPKNTSDASVTHQIAGPFNLCNLKGLRLRSCSMLRSLFSPSTAISLTSLEELEIEKCHGLRYLVTSKEDHDSQSYISMFPRLRRIRVAKCKLLEYIFHASFAQGLVELKYISIKDTPQLRYVFGQSIHDVHSSLPYQKKIQIKLSILEKLNLSSIPNMINTCSDNYYVTTSSLPRVTMNDVGLSTFTLMVLSGAKHSCRNSTTDIGATSMRNRRMLGTIAKIKGNNHVEESPINVQVTSSLGYLALRHSPELTSLWTGAEHFVSLQHLYELSIWGCPKLKVIFPPSVLRSLPLLEILAIAECDKLEQIIEEDEENEKVSLSNLQSPNMCFPRLKLLLVTRCNNLKHLFYISTSQEFPKLECLMLSQDSHLEEVFEGKQGRRERRLEVLLPELKHVILTQLPNLNNIYQWIEFQTATNLFVHNCPKLSLTSTTTTEDMLQRYDLDDKIKFYVIPELSGIHRIISEETAKKDPMLTSQLQMISEDESSCKSELPSSQVHGTNQSMLRNLAGSVQEHNRIEIVAIKSESENKGRQDLQSLEYQQSTIPSPNLTELVEQDSTNSELDFLDGQYALGGTKSIKEDMVKESVQERSVSQEAMKPSLSAGVDGVSSGDGDAANHESSGGNMLTQNSQVVEQGDKLNEGETRTSPCQKVQNGNDHINMMDKEGEIGVVSNYNIEAHPDDQIELYVCHDLHGIDDIISEKTAKKDPMLTSQLQLSLEDEASFELASSQIHGTNQSILHNFAGLVHEHNQTKSIAITLESENKGTQDFQLLKHQQSPIPSPNLTKSMKEDMVKESVQAGSTSQEAMKPTLSARVEGVSLGGGVAANHESSGVNILSQDSQVVEQGDKRNEGQTTTSPYQEIQNGNDSVNMMDKEGEIGGVSNDNIKSPLGASADTSRSHSLIIAKLGKFKHFVDLDDAHTALLVEAIAVYPHLWDVCQKFRVPFQAWMFKTLADMLFFLRNESAMSITPEGEKEFHSICDEAVQLGFERSWINEMRQRVMVRNLGVDNAQARISELLKRHDQLTQELRKLKDEINSLNDFVDAQKKCFDFL